MGAIELAAEAAERAAQRGPEDAGAFERVGRLRLRLMHRERALAALEQARRLGPSVEGLLDLALAYHLAGDLGGEVTATEQATLIAPEDGRPGRAMPMRWPAPTGSATRSRPLERALATRSGRRRGRRAARDAARTLPHEPCGLVVRGRMSAAAP